MIEVIELKGQGHPDTICDRLSERLAENLIEAYKKQYGKIMHYNVDKVLASCGQVDYKAYKMVKPVKIVFSGNATKVDNIKELLKQTTKEVLSTEILRGLKYRIYNHISECSPDLSDNFRKKKCNDTSFSVGSPITPEESRVLYLSSEIDRLPDTFPEVGTDYKIMSIGGKITLAIALRCMNAKDYFITKKRLKQLFKRNGFELEINTADTKDAQFNTITGTSLEQGDAGMTGRGNRYNGLITPMKPMTMEAYCGKNNVTHIGRIYQKLSFELAQDIKKNVLMVNQIGKDVKKPQVITW